jgi:hypothetical protein
MGRGDLAFITAPATTHDFESCVGANTLAILKMNPRESGAADRTPPPLLLRKALQAEVGVLLGLIPRPVGGEPA